MSDIRERLQHWLEIDLDKLTANLQTVNGCLREQRPDAPPASHGTCSQKPQRSISKPSGDQLDLVFGKEA